MKHADFDEVQSRANLSKLMDKFGGHIMVPLEQIVFQFASACCRGYAGGMWAFVSPDHPIMVPVTDDPVWHIRVPTNFYDGSNTDPDAFGHAASLIAFNHILFKIGESANVSIPIDPLIKKFDGMKQFSFDTLTGDALTNYIGMID